jgi:hypothetical protein
VQGKKPQKASSAYAEFFAQTFESSLDQIDPDTLTQLNASRQFSPLGIIKKVVRDPPHKIVEIAESKKRLAAGSKILTWHNGLLRTIM